MLLIACLLMFRRRSHCYSLLLAARCRSVRIYLVARATGAGYGSGGAIGTYQAQVMEALQQLPQLLLIHSHSAQFRVLVAQSARDLFAQPRS